MSQLGRIICETIVLEYGRDELLSRLAHPFWFQSFGAVMGMDWHSSGITTSVIGALKRGLAPVTDELGLYVCGGRGRHSRKTPGELLRVAERIGLDGAALARTSRLVAKVDSAAVQDGFDLYLHGFVLASDGHWTIVQQGMAPDRHLARRYHWHCRKMRDFVAEPHSAVAGDNLGPILNLVAPEAESARQAQLALIESGPDAALKLCRDVLVRAQPQLCLPHHHDVREDDVQMRRLHATLIAAAERGPRDFADLLLLGGVGRRTVEVLAHVAHIVHGTALEFADPARFSFALGGKDGHPFPVPLDVYDHTLEVLRAAVSQANLGNRGRLETLRLLDSQSHALDGVAAGLPFAPLVAAQRRRVSRMGGRTVMDDRPPAAERGSRSRIRPASNRAKPRTRRKQMQLF